LDVAYGISAEYTRIIRKHCLGWLWWLLRYDCH